MTMKVVLKITVVYRYLKVMEVATIQSRHRTHVIRPTNPCLIPSSADLAAWSVRPPEFTWKLLINTYIFGERTDQAAKSADEGIRSN